MKLNELDSLGHSFEFLRLPAFLAGAELELVLASHRRKFEEGSCAKALFIDSEGPHTSEDLRRLKDFCRHAAEAGSACYMIDNALLAKRTNAEGILFSSFPKAPIRLREVLGPSAHFGLKLKAQEMKREVEKQPGADQIDFFFFEDARQIAAANQAAKAQKVQSLEDNLRRIAFQSRGYDESGRRLASNSFCSRLV